MPNIPCSVAILTHNSGATLGRALESAREFADIIVCDGGSTDSTLDIARQYGARIIVQDLQFVDSTGKINNFSGVRNQTLASAQHDWYFFLDSDEYLSPELVEEIRVAVAGEPAAFWVPRKYVYRGTVIDCAVTYPNVQMRLFNKRVVQQFVKAVHERIELKAGTQSRHLTAAMLVPVPDTAAELVAKWRTYLDIEAARRSPMSWGRWIGVASHEAAIGLLYLVRLVRIQLLCRGAKLPVSYEWARAWYQWRLIVDSFGAIQ